MSTITSPRDPETNPRIKAVFDDIRATRKSDFINNLWYYLAFDTELLEATWRDVKEVMTIAVNIVYILTLLQQDQKG